MQRNFWKLFSLNRPWDSDLEVLSCVAGGIIWCLIKTGSVSALDTSSPSSLLPALSQFPWIKSQLGLDTTRQGGEEINFTGKPLSSHWPDSKYWILSPSKTHQIFLLKKKGWFETCPKIWNPNVIIGFWLYIAKVAWIWSWSFKRREDRVRCPPFSQDQSIKSIVSFSKWWSTFGARQMKYRQLPDSNNNSHTYGPIFSRSGRPSTDLQF